MIYGKIKITFTLKQLIFIGNEKSDNLNIHEYKNKYIEISNQIIDELFNAYNINNILGALVQDIYILLKKEFGKDFNSILDSLIVSKEDGVREDIYEDIKNNLSLQEELKEIQENNNIGESNDPLERFAKKFFIVNRDHYDCHIKGTYICNGKFYKDYEE